MRRPWTWLPKPRTTPPTGPPSTVSAPPPRFIGGSGALNGGTGLPSDASRETQIAVATRLRDATGGYGSWPACSAELGLPQ